MNDPDDHESIDAITEELKLAVGQVSEHVVSFYNEGKETEEIAGMLDLVFSIVIAIMMFLCFFSLTATMSANLFD